MQPAPLPVYESERLIGVELEYDSGRMSFRAPEPLPANWVSKYDGSLANGREFVLEPAVKYNQLMPHIESFSDAFDQIKIGLTTRGGFHVHVQCYDYTHDNAFDLASIYTHFQPVINQLLGASRVNNRFCMPFPVDLTKAQLVDEFSLDEPAPTREQAKYARTYRVINFAMMRCANPSHRSVEFRQGSPSKRFANIYGWSTFVTTLTDLARDPAAVQLAMNCPQTLGGLLELLQQWQLSRCGVNIAEWVAWRHDIMNGQPTEEMFTKLTEFLANGSAGLFSIATALDVNYPMAKKLLTEASSRGLVLQSGSSSRWRLARASEDQVADVLAELREASLRRESQNA